MILTGHTGTNADIFPAVLQMYVEEGSVVADVTYGKGVFWKNVPEDRYDILKSDIVDGVDFRNLAYPNSSIDALVLDPPYMHGGKTVKKSINKCYRNENGSHASVIRLYCGGILEAERVLKQNGILIVKTQDEIESGKQRWSHIEIMDLMRILGFELLDLFVLLQSTIPAMREKYQKTARKNHSYFIVGRKR